MGSEVEIKKVDNRNKKDVFLFIKFPHHLYRDSPYWVPPLNRDILIQLNKNKYPFYEHSDADFFIALKNGKIVGRVAVIENKRYNRYHSSETANFYFFDCENDIKVAEKLFDAVFEWSKKRNLKTIIGPKGFGPFDGYGLLVSGFDQIQTMNMLNYNFEYYPELIKKLGFVKEVDFVTYYIPKKNFKIPERIEYAAKMVMKKNCLNIYNFKDKRELMRYSWKIGKLYNSSFVNNWEFYPLTNKEIEFIARNIIAYSDHRLIKVITYKDEIVGFVFAFPDISKALKRAKGKITPLSLVNILMDFRKTDKLTVNGIGIIPEFQGHGGNSLLYYELGKTILSLKRFKHIEMPQIAETARQMTKDVITLNGVEYKRHRVYRKNM